MFSRFLGSGRRKASLFACFCCVLVCLASSNLFAQGSNGGYGSSGGSAMSAGGSGGSAGYAAYESPRFMYACSSGSCGHRGLFGGFRARRAARFSGGNCASGNCSNGNCSNGNCPYGNGNCPCGANCPCGPNCSCSYNASAKMCDDGCTCDCVCPHCGTHFKCNCTNSGHVSTEKSSNDDDTRPEKQTANKSQRSEAPPRN